MHNSHLWTPQAGCGCVRRRPAFCQPQAKRAHRRGRARRVQPLLIVHFKNTRMRVDVLGPQSLHHRQHPMGRICVILFQLIFVEQLLQRLFLLRGNLRSGDQSEASHAVRTPSRHWAHSIVRGGQPEHSYRQLVWWFPGCELEQDDCDREDDDPDEAKRHLPEMCPRD